jgi:ABC-2 type transport system ATP-binding protein
VDQLLERFQLKKSDMKRKTGQYSKGMLQKLGIVQAFMHKPELIILDEPTSGLDALMQEEFYSVLREYHHSGTTFFFSSHNLPEVEKLCSRVAIIKDGEIISTETIDNLRKKTGRIIHIELDQINKAPEISGMILQNADGNRFTYKLTGAYPEVLYEISKLPILDVIIEKPSLEAVFMDFYKTPHQ